MPPRREAATELSTAFSLIAADLERRLDSGEWPVGMAIASRRQLARQYKVGERTIRRALETLQSEGRLVINPRGKMRVTVGTSLSDTFTGALVVVFSFPMPTSLDYRGLMWRGICRSLERTGRPLIALQHSSRWRTAFPAGLRHLPIAGVVLIGPFKPQLVAQYEQLRKPVVLLDQPYEGGKLFCVCVDNYNAAFDATSRLIEQGHRRLAFIRLVVSSLQNVDPDSRDRESGFRAACRAAGLRDSEIRIFSTMSQEPANYRTLFKQTPRVTGVLSTSPQSAECVLASARAKGLDIPRDVSVLTFRATHAYPRDFSGPSTDFENMGQLAAEQIYKPSAKPHTLRVPTIWNEGDTMGPA